MNSCDKTKMDLIKIGSNYVSKNVLKSPHKMPLRGLSKQAKLKNWRAL